MSAARGRRLAGLLIALATVPLGCRGPNTQKVHPQLVPPGGAADFGDVPVLNIKSMDIPFQNVGRASLTVVSAVIKEMNTPFAVKSAPSSVESGATDNVTVVFIPPAEMAYAATLEVTTDDPTTPVVDVALTGKGSTVASMVLMPPVLDFGRVNEGTHGLQLLTIESKGTADLVLNNIAFSPDTPSAFSFLGSVTTPATVKVGSQIQLTVEFYAAPGSMGPSAGTLLIDSTDPTQQDAGVPMTATLNRAPIPVIAALGNGAPGQVINLDGTGSYSPEGNTPLTYQWKLANFPAGASTQIASPTASTTTMTLDPTLPGSYDVTLDVTDSLGAKDLQPAKATIVAVPAQKLLIEMFQDRPDTDLDIHFLRTTTSAVGTAPDDCFYANPNPNWSTTGTPDGPLMAHDALTGYGPNVTWYDNPITSTFRVVVGFTSAHLVTNPTTVATVRIYEFGVEKAELSRALMNEGDFWLAADVDWPSGTITPGP